MYGLEYSRGVSLSRERSYCTFANQYLGSQHSYPPQLIDLGSTSKWHILSGIARELHWEIIKYWKRLPCTSMVLILLEAWTVLTATLLSLFQEKKLVCESGLNSTSQWSAFRTISWVQRMSYRVLKISSGTWYAWRQLRTTTVIFCELERAWNGHAAQLNVSALLT